MEETAVVQSAKKTNIPKKIMHELYEWVEVFIFVLACVIAFLTFVARGTIVEGDSMLPTLEDKQFLLISHLYTSLNHGDIVVIYAKDIETGFGMTGRNVIKRVIGLPGDTIRIDTEAGLVYRNDEPLPVERRDGSIFENNYTISSETKTRFDMPDGIVWTVPENCIFVLGDNRNHSKDSRSSDVGMIEQNYVIGRVVFRITPLSEIGTVT
jgi:signal peptidase I